MKRILLRTVCSLSLCCTCAVVYAKNSVHLTLDSQMKDLIAKLDEFVVETPLGEDAIELTSAVPDVGGVNWYGFIDVLFWRAKVAGTKYAYSNSRFSTNQPVLGRAKECEFGWDWGLRLGVGRNFNHDQWSASGEFTYYRTGGNSKLVGGETTAVIPLRGPFAQPVHVAKSSMKDAFYNLDVNLYRHYFISAALALKPSIGLKNTWLSLKQVVKYNDGTNLGFNTAETRDKSKFWGIGPKAGIDTTWHLYNGLQLYGNVAGSLLYSYFKVEEYSILTPTRDHDFLMKDKKHLFVPNIQFNLGIGYSSFIREKRNYISFRLGYETLYYFRANQMLNLTEFNNTFRFDNMSEDVSMYGVTFSAKLYF